MSNPIEQARLKREKTWDKARVKEASKRTKKSLAEAEEQVLAQREERAEKARRAARAVPLATIQRDVINFLRDAHRAVGIAEIGSRVSYNVAGDDELMTSLRLHSRVHEESSGAFSYRPKYQVSNLEEMAALIESRAEGVVVSELQESYHDALVDVEQLKRSARVFAMPNKIIGSEILFPCYAQHELAMPLSLRDGWSRVAIPDPKKLEAQLCQLGLPVAIAPVALTKVRRKRAKKNANSSGRSAKDHYNGTNHSLLISFFFSSLSLSLCRPRT